MYEFLPTVLSWALQTSLLLLMAKIKLHFACPQDTIRALYIGHLKRIRVSSSLIFWEFANYFWFEQRSLIYIHTNITTYDTQEQYVRLSHIDDTSTLTRWAPILKLSPTLFCPLQLLGPAIGFLAGLSSCMGQIMVRE